MLTAVREEDVVAWHIKNSIRAHSWHLNISLSSKTINSNALYVFSDLMVLLVMKLGLFLVGELMLCCLLRRSPLYREKLAGFHKEQDDKITMSRTGWCWNTILTDLPVGWKTLSLLSHSYTSLWFYTAFLLFQANNILVNLTTFSGVLQRIYK